jgi:hypothetical protein
MAEPDAIAVTAPIKPACFLRGRKHHLKTDSVDTGPKTILDSLLLPIAGVEGGEMSGFTAYFVNKKMFACINGSGVGVRLPALTAANLQFSNANAAPFQPNGRPSSREWVQLNHEDPADYRKDVDIFTASIEFVKADKKKQ